MNVEGRDWVGNPDGTLVYWQREAEEARRKLVDIAKLCDESADETEKWLNQHPEDRGVVHPGGNLTVEEVRAILADVQPEPVGAAVNTDALLEALSDEGDPTDPAAHERYARIVAHLRPLTMDRTAVARHLCHVFEGDPDKGLDRPVWHKWLPEADALIAASVVPVEGDLKPEPAPAGGTIDRDALDAEILAWYLAQKPDLDLADLGDRIAGIIRGSVGLNQIEARIAHGWFVHVALTERVSVEENALAERLEAAS